MMGFIKRLAMAAVLMRALRQLLDYAEYMISPLLLLLLLFGSYFAFYFFFTGTADMARGICFMYGIRTPRDRGHVLAAGSPDRVLCGIALSLYRFMLDYVYEPLKRVLPAKTGHFWARITVFVLSALFFRTRPEMLLFALPMLLLVLLSLMWSGRRHRLYLRVLFAPLMLLACSFFTLAMMMDRPMKMFALIGEAFANNTGVRLYHVFEAVRDFRYLLVVMAVFLVLVPLTYLSNWFWRCAGAKLRITVKCVTTVLLFTAFACTVFYLMPQFPGYADQAYGFYQYTR